MCALTSHVALNWIIQRGITIDNQMVRIDLLGPRTVSVAIYMVSIFVLDEDLEVIPNKYGNVHFITALRYRNLGDKRNIRTGTRIAKMKIDTTNPLRNYVRVQGYLATCQYPGIRRVCQRCRLEGRIHVNCTAPFCNSCSSYGHESKDCS